MKASTNRRTSADRTSGDKENRRSRSPSRRRDRSRDNKSRSGSGSRSKSRDRKKRRERSPDPRPCRIHIGRLTRNVTKDHIMEIFGVYGEIRNVEYPMDRMHPATGKGFCYIEYINAEDAENAMKHMDGGQIDGQEVTAAPCLQPKRPVNRRFSPARNQGNRQRWRSPGRFGGRNMGGGGGGRRSPFRGGGGFDRRRGGGGRSRSRSPRRRRRSSTRSSSR